MFRVCVARFSASSDSRNNKRQRIGFVSQIKMFNIAEVIAVDLVRDWSKTVDLDMCDVGVKRDVLVVSKLSA